MRLTHVSLTLASLLPAFSETHTLAKETSAAMLDTAAREGVEVPAKRVEHQAAVRKVTRT